nr:hypothetical protein Iba_chr12dCG3430 [Ipomoea batatas]
MRLYLLSASPLRFRLSLSLALRPLPPTAHGVTAHRRQPSGPSLTVTGLRQGAPYYSVLTVDNTAQPHNTVDNTALRPLPPTAVSLPAAGHRSPDSPPSRCLLRVSSSRWSQVTGLTAQPLPAACLFPYCSPSAPRMEGDNSHVGGCDSFSPTPMSSPVEYPNSSPVDSPSARNEAETQETQGTSQTVEGVVQYFFQTFYGDKAASEIEKVKTYCNDLCRDYECSSIATSSSSEDYEIDEDLLLPQQLEA